MKRLFILIVIIFFQFQIQAQNRPIVGAIRWDAWLGKDDGVGQGVNSTLGPSHWHYRLPFYSTVIDTNIVNIDATAQTVSDQEIRYASYAHLDYFAFLMYKEDHSLSIGLNNYLASSEKSKVNFCVIMNVISNEEVSYSVHRVITYMQEPSYQKVMGNRPLIYTLQMRDTPDYAKQLKDSCTKRGWPEPYIVDLHWLDTMPTDAAFDGISCYWYNGTSSGGSTTGAPYTNLMNFAQANWQTRKNAGCKQIPLVSLGADGRPRIETSVSWITDPASMYSKYFITPTPQEIVTHLGQAFDFIKENPTSCEANAVLMYAWNENDEGGWLVPSLNTNGDTNTTRIDALRDFLMKFDGTPTFDSIGITPVAWTVQPEDTITLSTIFLDQFKSPFDTSLTITWQLQGGGILLNNTGKTNSFVAKNISDSTTVVITASAGGKQTSINISVISCGKLTGTVIGSNNATNPDHAEKYAFDGDINTYTEMDGWPRQAGLQFNEVMSFCKLRYYPRLNYQSRMPGVEIQTSTDCNTWTTIHTVTSGEVVNGAWTTIDLESGIEGKCVRMNHPGNYLTIAEFEIWGSAKNLATTINDEQDIKIITIYPNPAIDKVIIEGVRSLNVITFTNTFGQIVLQQQVPINNYQVSINIQELPAGIYFVRIGNEEQKLIHNRGFFSN